MTPCPKCQFENRQGVRFCEQCGAKLDARCPACGAVVPTDRRFCGECGQSLDTAGAPSALNAKAPRSYTPAHLAEKILTSRSALEGERKQVTVLFCDIANSTELAERLGPETMHGVLNSFFELALAEVHRYEGTINQFLGDGFMALFGAPIAHEDHAHRAVLAALAIQSALRKRRAQPADEGHRLIVRMGLNTGLVVVGTIGDNLRMDYTAVGETTNLSARLQQHAAPETILVSEVTHRLVKGYVRVEALTPLQVKGKTEAVAAYRVIGLGSRRSRLESGEDRALSQFVGRERELAALSDVLAAAETGRGQVVGVLGEPGVGKSRLVYEFRRSLGERRVTCLEARCLSYGMAIPYLPLQEIIRDTCGITEADTPGEIGEKVRVALEEVGMEAEDRTPYLLQLLGVKEAAERLAEIGPETIKARIFETLRQMMLNGSQRRLQLVIVEDLHWVDKSSEEYFASLVESVAGAGVLFLTTYRSGYQPPWLGKSYATQIALRPLSAEDSRRVMQSTVQRADLPGTIADEILAKAEGNPLFLEELTRAVMERAEATPGTGVPDTIQGVLMARIDRLAEPVKRVLQTAAVLGREFSSRLLRAVSGDGGEDLAPHLAELKRCEFLYEREGANEATFVFKHALTQDVAYEALLTPRRQTLHEAAGRALEVLFPDRLEEYAELLAHHYSLSANADKAFESLERANQKAAHAYAMAEAEGFFLRAMAVLDTMPETQANRHRRLVLLVNQFLVFFLLFKIPTYRQLLERHRPLAEQSEDVGLRGAFYARVGHGEWQLGFFDKGLQTLSAAVELCEAAGNAEDGAFAYMVLAWSHVCKGDFDRVFFFKEKVDRKTEQRLNLRWYAWTLAAASWAHSYVGRWDTAIEEGQKELKAGEQFSDNGVISFGALSVSIAHTLRGDLASAVEYAELAVERGPTPADQAWARAFLAWAWCRGGQPHRGIEVLAPLVPMYRAARFLWLEVVAMLLLGEGYWLAGECDKAKRTLEELLAIAEPRGMRFYLGSARRLLAEVSLTSDPSQAASSGARHHFEKSIAVLRQINAENELALAYAGYGRLHKQQGRLTEARRYLTLALEIFERLGTLIEPDKLRARLAELPAG